MMPRHSFAARSAAETYRAVDLAGRTSGASSHALVDLLYEEGARALRGAAFAAANNQPRVRSERVTRATAILFALEAGLDFEKGGEVSRALANFYAGLRARVIQASLGTDPAPFRAAADDLAEIAGAWASLKAG